MIAVMLSWFRPLTCNATYKIFDLFLDSLCLNPSCYTDLEILKPFCYLPVLTTVFCFCGCKQLLKRKHDKCEAELNRLQAQVVETSLLHLIFDHERWSVI